MNVYVNNALVIPDRVGRIKTTVSVPTQKQLDLVAKIDEQINYIVNTKTRKNYSAIITNTLPYNYTYLSNRYKLVTGNSIQQQIIKLKIERAKKLITEKTPLTKVWQTLNYCSLAAFSNQFKAVTGTSPLAYKKSLKQ